MSTILDLCEKYYETRDLYKLLNITKNADVVDAKKAYYQQSLQWHPDRVTDAYKDEATEKFKLITKIKLVLTDPVKKALYDEKSIIIDDDDANLDASIDGNLWRQFFKPISDDEVADFRKKYIGSETEAKSIYESYNKSKGCITFIMENVPFISIHDEPRIVGLIKGWINGGYLPEYSQFIEEPKPKQNRRYMKYGRPNIELVTVEKSNKIPKTLAIAAKTNDNDGMIEQKKDRDFPKDQDEEIERTDDRESSIALNPNDHVDEIEQKENTEPSMTLKSDDHIGVKTDKPEVIPRTNRLEIADSEENVEDSVNIRVTRSYSRINGDKHTFANDKISVCSPMESANKKNDKCTVKKFENRRTSSQVKKPENARRKTRVTRAKTNVKTESSRLPSDNKNITDGNRRITRQANGANLRTGSINVEQLKEIENKSESSQLVSNNTKIIGKRQKTGQASGTTLRIDSSNVKQPEIYQTTRMTRSYAKKMKDHTSNAKK